MLIVVEARCCSDAAQHQITWQIAGRRSRPRQRLTPNSRWLSRVIPATPRGRRGARQRRAMWRKIGCWRRRAKICCRNNRRRARDSHESASAPLLINWRCFANRRPTASGCNAPGACPGTGMSSAFGGSIARLGPAGEVRPELRKHQQSSPMQHVGTALPTVALQEKLTAGTSARRTGARQSGVYSHRTVLYEMSSGGLCV